MTQLQVKTPDQIARYLKAHNRMVKLSFWLGAGASESAGIPTATALAQEIETRFDYNFAETWSPGLPISRYAFAMSRLEPMERKLFLHDVIGRAGAPNRAQLLIAQLAAHGMLNAVLTTNFDEVFVRAMREKANPNPWVVDLRSEGDFGAEVIPPGGAVYLNGFGENNRVFDHPGRADAIARAARQAIARAAQDSVVIVLGYSGDKDPLFEMLAEGEFRHGLYWVAQGAEPSEHVEEKILRGGKRTGFLGGWDADRFMTELVVRGLGLPDAAVGAPSPAAPVSSATPGGSRRTEDEFIYTPAAAFDEESAVKLAHEALVVGGSEDLLRLADNALAAGATRTFGPLAEALIDWGGELVAAGDLDTAETVFQRVTRLAPENPEGFVGLGNVAEKRGDRATASQMSHRAFELSRRG